MGIWRILHYLKPYRWRVASVFLLMLVTTGLQMLNPRILGQIIDYVNDRAGAGLQRGDIPTLLLGGGAILGIVILRGVLQFGQTSLSGRVGQTCLFDLRNDIYQHLQSLSYSFFDKTQTGQLLSRVTADVESLRNFLGQGFISMFSQLLTIIALILVTFSINWRLAVVSLFTIPFMSIVTYKLAFVVRPAFLRIQQQVGVINEHLQETLTGIRTVQASGQERRRGAEFREVSNGFLQRTLDQVRLRSTYTPALEFLAGVGTIGILWYGGWLVIGGYLTLGILMSFLYYLALLIQPMRMLGFQIGQLQQAVASAERIFEILDAVPDIQDAPDAICLSAPRGQVRFENISFSYSSGRPVLTDINLDVPPGTIVALVGGAGSGKTSMANLIPRFYDPTSGRVTLDGTDIQSIVLKDLRRHVGVVAQDPYLFSLSLRENIAFGRENATQADIEAAARTAQIHDFIASLPGGYETVVGERGIGLSGGQKQRVAIARALLTDPVILILDDSLSAVDTETEYRLQQALEAAMAGRTTFIIAHRLSTVEMADMIVVLEAGFIVQVGRHADLVRTAGPYRDIYLMQLRGELEDDEMAPVPSGGSLAANP